MTPEQLLDRARQIVHDHAKAIAPLMGDDGDILDDSLYEQYDETNESYAWDALELLQQLVREAEQK